MFVDQVKINVKAGNGGNGIVAFRREKFVPNGGPAGGDGGHGGSVIFAVETGMSTLMDFHYKRKFVAERGADGGNKKMTGRSADDLVVYVPEGTSIYDNDTNKLLYDLVDKGDSYTVAAGGRGGRGNTHFASAKNSAPEIAENGEPGEERSIRLELKVLADVGLVGFPSVGKSTLLSTVTSSKPKVAQYHFTTLVPNLGMVKLDNGRDFAIADLPGLIEGASSGVGLGFQFLRHVERTRVILHLVDMSGQEGRTPIEDYQKINDELSKYDNNLLKRPQIIVATKMDIPDSEENLKEFKNALSKNNDNVYEVIPISSVTHSGLSKLISETAELLEKTPKFPITDTEEPVEDESEYKFDANEKPFEISRDEDGTWILSGKKIEKLFKMTDTTHDQSMLRFARQLRGMGVDNALRKAGAENGDLVSILDFTFSYVD
ncbi:GTPase ObgE [Apilactobacillus micheneri]|uniref:GTPase ObgE n=1 Tax=Apilactobacillus micheneri TaxID=1899430 RepID=UPI00112782F5|nr:GTPase ObgE [Apilactobacillus micheneri]TPR44881.1 GTPase ObgE [Apilactobacillus micheneri]TPR48438.1 GTPase ObgE [Apilactobacillus micheneri]